MIVAKRCASKRYLNKVNLNINKNNIKQVSSIKYLGVILDNQLNWQEHIKNIQTKLARITGIFYKIRHYVPTKILLMLYNALAGSYLRYGILAWGSCSTPSTLQSSQDKVLRAILFKPYTADVTTDYTQLKVLNVKNMYYHEVSKMIHSVYYLYCPLAFFKFF